MEGMRPWICFTSHTRTGLAGIRGGRLHDVLHPRPDGPHGGGVSYVPRVSSAARGSGARPYPSTVTDTVAIAIAFAIAVAHTNAGPFTYRCRLHNDDRAYRQPDASPCARVLRCPNADDSAAAARFRWHRGGPA